MKMCEIVFLTSS